MTSYCITRMRFDDTPEVRYIGLTLEEAQEHCSDERTSGDGWFDGYTDEDNWRSQVDEMRANGAAEGSPIVGYR